MADLGAIGVYKDGGFNYKAGYTISGTVLDSSGAAVKRPVNCLLEITSSTTERGLYEKTAYSDPATGAFSMPTGDNNPRTLVVTLESGKNALVFAGVVPV